MKSLPARIISAVVAALIIIATIWFGGPYALLGLGFFLCVIGIYEYFKIAFSKHGLPKFFGICFIVTSIYLLSDLIIPNSYSILIRSVLLIAFVSLSLSLTWLKVNNTTLLSAIALAVLGFLYSALLPSFALKLLLDHQSLPWFFLLLIIVFAGDIFAYFGGNFFGKHKLMPEISPNKTVEGSISGIIGSTIAGLIFAHYFLPNAAPMVIALSSTFAAVLAQMGDMFESLVKRVADVKDSGRIMPGHGGVLDRLDGVYFAAPLVYAVSQWSVF